MFGACTLDDRHVYYGSMMEMRKKRGVQIPLLLGVGVFLPYFLALCFLLGGLGEMGSEENGREGERG